MDSTSNLSTRAGISVNWASEHRRSAEIASVAGVVPYYFRSRYRPLPLRYLVQHIQTQRQIKASRPDVVVVMQPPAVALLSVLLSRTARKAVIVGDLHSGVFLDPKWAWAKSSILKVLRRRGFAVVPNGDLARMCSQAGTKSVVCHGFIVPDDRNHSATSRNDDDARPYVLAPLTYSRDEPVQDLLDAAQMTPQIDWVLTGRAPEWVTRQAGDNVKFPGFVSRTAYRELRLDATAIVALTTQESTMQSAGYEATASATPLVTSDTVVLRDYFGDSARYTSTSASSIAEAVKDVVGSSESWGRLMEEHRARVVETQGGASEQIRTMVSVCRSEG